MEKQENKKTPKKSIKKVDLEDVLERRGLLEAESLMKNLIENKQIQQTSKVLLSILLFAGFTGIAIVAPNLFSALKLRKYGFKRYRSDDIKKFKNSFYQLRRRDLVDFTRVKDKQVAILTPDGKQKALELLFNSYKIQPKKKWDGMWRIVIFDIPNEKNRFRDVLRQRLENMGFFQMQRSVFVSPFECKNELDILCEVYDLWDFVNYFEAVFIDNEGDLRSFFGL